jgi:SET domain-containing protein|tara:strand:+ start:734 stop:1048 length:315 start_codon:yes stop_codon:yes gene_type:complete
MYNPLPDGLIIAKSRIHSQGLFTTKFIDKNVKLGLSHVIVGDKIIRTPLGGFINHSDTPNCVKVRGVLGRNEVEDYDKYFLYTERDIKAWEELTLKYTFYKVKN